MNWQKKLREKLNNGVSVNRWPKGKIPFAAADTFGNVENGWNYFWILAIYLLIFYKLLPASAHQEALKRAILEINQNTNVKFTPRTFENDYVYIQKGEKESGYCECFASGYEISFNLFSLQMLQLRWSSWRQADHQSRSTRSWSTCLIKYGKTKWFGENRSSEITTVAECITHGIIIHELTHAIGEELLTYI